MQSSTTNLFFIEGTSLGDVVVSISPIAGPLADLFSPLSPSAFVSEAGLGDTPWKPGLDWPIVELFLSASETVYEDLKQGDMVEEQEKPNKFSPNFEKATLRKIEKLKLIKKFRTKKDRVVNGK